MSSTTQLYAYIALTAYLAPCAWQDWRMRKVSNWLTLPAFVAAWPLAIWFGNLEWTVAVFLGCYIAWQFKGMGAADGKLATMMAAVVPGTILISVILLFLVFLLHKVSIGGEVRLPAIVIFIMSSILVIADMLLW